MSFDYQTFNLDAFVIPPLDPTPENWAKISALREAGLDFFLKGQIKYILVKGKRFKIEEVK